MRARLVSSANQTRPRSSRVAAAYALQAALPVAHRTARCHGSGSPRSAPPWLELAALPHVSLLVEGKMETSLGRQVGALVCLVTDVGCISFWSSQVNLVVHGESEPCVYIYIYVHTHIYIYILVTTIHQSACWIIFNTLTACCPSVSLVMWPLSIVHK
jgi:hypothetical protein